MTILILFGMIFLFAIVMAIVTRDPKSTGAEHLNKRRRDRDYGN